MYFAVLQITLVNKFSITLSKFNFYLQESFQYHSNSPDRFMTWKKMKKLIFQVWLDICIILMHYFLNTLIILNLKTFFQISMNVLMALIPVMRMLTVLIFLVATTAHVELDMMEMGPGVKVTQIMFYFLCVSSCDFKTWYESILTFNNR